MLILYCRALYIDHRPLPVPTSFLINTDGEVTAIYKGTVTVEQINEDIAHLHASPEQRRLRATPFKGRWLTPRPANLFPTGLADQMINENLLDEAIAYLAEFGGSDRNHPFRRTVMMKLISKLRKQGRHELADRLMTETRLLESPQPAPSPDG